MSKTFRYVFSDGHEMWLEPSSASMEMIAIYCQDNNCELVSNGYREHLEGISYLRINSHSKGDGFKPGYQPALGMHVSSHEQFQAELKSRGLVEVGREKQKEAPKSTGSIFTEEIIKEAVSMGADISGQEADKLLGKSE